MLSALPRPSSMSLVSELAQSSAQATRIALQETIAGNPGWVANVDMILSEGWPAGIHHGKIGAKPAASTNVSILRLIQPLIFGIGLLFFTFCQTTKSHTSSAIATGTQP